MTDQNSILNYIEKLLTFWDRPFTKQKISSNKEQYLKMWLSGEEILVVLFTTTTRFGELIRHPAHIVNAASSKIKTIIVFLYATQRRATTITNLTRSLGKLTNVNVYFFTQLNVLTGFRKTTTEHIKKITIEEGRLINRLLINPALSPSQTYPSIDPRSWPALLWKELYHDNLLIKYRIPQLHGGYVNQTGYIVPWKIGTILDSKTTDAITIEKEEHEPTEESGAIFLQ